MSYHQYVTCLQNGAGEIVEIREISLLEESRKQAYISAAERNPKSLSSLSALKGDGVIALSVKGGDSIDYIFVVKPGDARAEQVFCEDCVSYESISPTQLVEYCFDDEIWMVSLIGLECLDSYKELKYQTWKSNMLKAFDGCAAAFLPEIKRGYVLSNVYDHMIFPSELTDKHLWETEHNGRVVPIPRPVKRLRLWNATTNEYDEISSNLPGAPDPADREQHWATFLNELRQKLNPVYGDEFIDDCLRLDKIEIKSKYF